MGLRSRIGNLEQRIEGLLQRVPGYAGYRDKESRRDDDKRLRESIADDIRAQVDVLTKYNADVAGEREFDLLNRLEQVVVELRTLGDRIRTASYGYGGIMGDRDVDASALDQLRQFDLALEREVTTIGDSVQAVTGSMPPSGDALRELSTRIGSVSALFNGRSEIMTTAKPSQDQKVLALLEPADESTPSPLLVINRGDTFSVLGDNFVANATIRIQSDAGNTTLARIDEAPDGATWFFASDISGVETSKLTESREDAAGFQSMTPATVTIDSAEGARGSVPAYYAITSGNGKTELRLSISDSLRVFRGITVNDIDIEVYGSATS